MRLQHICLALILLPASLLPAQSVDIQVELTNQIGTDTSRKGDTISGRVLSPANLKGDFVEGKITESRSGAKLGGKSVFSFSFDTLRHGDSTVAINSQFKSATNSQGKANVDEEGRVVRRGTGNIAKAAGGTGLGALVGGLAGGGKGAAIGAVVGAGASIALIQLAADGPSIRFAAGSRILIEAKARSGPGLNTLHASAAPVATAAAPQPAAAPVPSASAPAPSTPPTAAQSAAAATSQPQPEFKSLRAAFVPGEKTLFYDDFSDMGEGDAPPHFMVRGAAPDLRASGSLRQLSITKRGSLAPNLTGLPQNFTMEAEVQVDGVRRAIMNVIFFADKKEVLHWTTSAMAGQVDQVASLRAPYQELGRRRNPASWNAPVKLALWVQNGRLRSFVDGEVLLDFNQVNLPAITRVEMTHDFYGANQTFSYRMVRFAESMPDFSQVISSTGRYVTHGILFDTGSDRLKPESGAVIQAVAKGLNTNPNLRLRIDGHTDSVGDAAQNLDLSRRRAEAVKSVLTAQFGVDAARLSTGGLGSTKPIDSNDTPQGRAQNRRVEFVRQ